MSNVNSPQTTESGDSSGQVGKVPLHRWLDPRFWLRMILLLEDTPHSIALGSTIGMYIAFIPPFGLQQFIYFFVIAICRPFFRFNIPAGYVLLYVSNPLTSPLIYWMNYKVGTIFLEGNVTYDHLVEKIQHTDSRSWTDFMLGLWQLMLELGWPFVLGSFVIAAVFAIPTYPIMYYLSKKYQLRVKIHEEHVHEKQLLREKQKSSVHTIQEVSVNNPEEKNVVINTLAPIVEVSPSTHELPGITETSINPVVVDQLSKVVETTPVVSSVTVPVRDNLKVVNKTANNDKVESSETTNNNHTESAAPVSTSSQL